MGSIRRMMNPKNKINEMKICNVEQEIRKKQKIEVSNDTQNRNYVVRAGVEYIKAGLSEEETLDKLMNDDIVKEFEYLKKNGLDIRNCFKNWIKAAMKKHGRLEYQSIDYTK